MAAQTESSFRCAARPNGLQVDAYWRKNRDVKNREQAFSKFLRLFEFKRNPTKPQVNHARPAVALCTNDRVGVCAGHRNALGFSRNRIGGGGRSYGGILARDAFGSGCRGNREFADQLLRSPRGGNRSLWRGRV